MQHEQEDLKFEVVVNADDPAERAVYISGHRYVTEQSLQSGPMIESILHDAVVLRRLLAKVSRAVEDDPAGVYAKLCERRDISQAEGLLRIRWHRRVTEPRPYVPAPRLLTDRPSWMSLP